MSRLFWIHQNCCEGTVPTALLLTMLGVTIVLIIVVITVRGVMVSRAGKLLAFIALFVFPGAAVFFGTTEHIERSKQTSFCLSCHIMQPYGRSLLLDDQSHIPAAHFENSRIPRDHACYTCHTNYTIYGTAKDKFRGLRHAYKYYIGHPANPIKLYEPFNNRECLHCHSGARSFREIISMGVIAGWSPELEMIQIGSIMDGCVAGQAGKLVALDLLHGVRIGMGGLLLKAARAGMTMQALAVVEWFI